MMEMVIVFIGLAMSFIVYPALLIEYKKKNNVRIAKIATIVNLAGIALTVIGLLVALLTYLL